MGNKIVSVDYILHSAIVTQSPTTPERKFDGMEGQIPVIFCRVQL